MSEPQPLQVPPGTPGLAPSDIITIEGNYTRPPFWSVAWWRCLVFGRIASIHFGRHPVAMGFCTQRDLFRRMELRKYRVTEAE